MSDSVSRLNAALEGRYAIERELLQVNDRTNRFTISVDGEPGSVVLDPDTWVLMDADFVRRN